MKVSGPLEMCRIERIATWYDEKDGPIRVGIISSNDSIVLPIGEVTVGEHRRGEQTDPTFSLSRDAAVKMFQSLGEILEMDISNNVEAELKIDKLESELEKNRYVTKELAGKVETLQQQVFDQRAVSLALQTTTKALQGNVDDLRLALQREIDKNEAIEEAGDLLDLKESILLIEQQEDDRNPNIPKTKTKESF